jgi:Transposase IS4
MSSSAASAAPGAAPAPSYDPSRPNITYLKYSDGKEVPYEPLFPLDGEKFSAAFVMPQGADPTPAALCEHYLPDWLLKRMVNSTTAYAASRLQPEKRQEVTESDILRFIAAISYMGVVRLPSKRDYFKASPTTIFPQHHTIMLTRTKFEYLWCNFHIEYDPGQDDDDDKEGDGDDPDEDDDDELEDLIFETDPEEDANDDDAEEEEEEEEAPQQAPPMWYSKVQSFVKHVNDVSKRLCRHPSWRLAIDEMMKRFKGRSRQTHKMKNKPVSEGFKFFAICDSITGFVYSFFPDGRLEGNTIYDCVMKLIETLPRRDNLNYVIAMDNYFTTQRVVKDSRNTGVGVVGTARYRRGWPPKEYREIQDDRFNSVNLLNDEANYLICRWIDNNQVNMVSTVHTGTESILRQRKKPRQTKTNKNHLQLVWGSEWVKDITIPGIIDDYNHWMGGVDKADQLIAYYRPNMRCVRTWMPIFLHCLDIIRVNSYIICKSKCPKLNHKAFLEQWIIALNQRAATADYQLTRRSIAALTSPPSAAKKPKRRRISHKNPVLPERRTQGKREEHICVVVDGKGKQKNCAMCSYVRAVAKLEGEDEEDLPGISRPARKCLFCDVHLCSVHFSEYHGWRS